LIAPVLVALAGLGGALALLGAAVTLVAIASARAPRVAPVPVMTTA
jgi:hypothetical protein